MDRISSTLVWYYYICHREVWLMAHDIIPEQDNDLIEIGRTIHKHSYKREKKEIALDGTKIDMLKRSDGTYIVCEIKKSSRFELSAKMQLAYSLYKLKEMGIHAKGELLVPKEKKRIEVELDGELEEKIRNAMKDIEEIIAKEHPPPPERNKFCSRCGYNYFCWA
ncbi:MAG: CRISPR-associated protein Cas4 [Methanomassiliicoccales archaeon]